MKEKSMTSSDVIDFYTRMKKRRIKIWIDGGWGIDALLSKQTRSHRDLDIAIERKNVAKLRKFLETQGYKEVKRDNQWNFVLGDNRGHEIDVHVFVFDDKGNVVKGITYPANSLTGTGTIDGHIVRCISPEYMVRFHSGYELKDKDFKDIFAICKKFGIALPKEYAHLKKSNDDTGKDINLRTTFNNEAELYQAVRPHYPEELFDTLVRITKLHSDAHLLEIGPGTGQATEPLARRGYRITAVELGADLAEVGQRVLRKYKNVQIITGAFEDIDFPPESFDLVYAATAFHWIKPEIKFTKPHKLLKSAGHLAIIDTNHVSDEAGDKFFFASQPIYKKYTGDSYDKKFRLKRTAELKADKIDKTLFAQIFFKAFPLVIRYSAKEYAQLLNTFSDTISMDPDRRTGFLNGIEKLIKEKFDGSIMKHFAMTLTIAKKRD